MNVWRHADRPAARGIAVLAAVAAIAPLQPIPSGDPAATPIHGLSKPAPVKAVGGPDITKPATIAPDSSAKLNMTAAPAVSWPTGQSDMDLPAALSGRVQPVWAQAGNLPVSARRASGSATSKVRVQVLDRATAQASGRPLVVRVAGDRAGDVQVKLDYRAFAEAYGGDWAGRLRLVALPECGLTTPESDGCAQKDLATQNDAGSRTATATVTLAAPSAGAGQLIALVAGDSSSSGDYKATPLQASSTWSAGGSSGDFTWSYPLRLPPGLGGPVPSVALSYSAQSVDGRTAASNSQPSWVGEGFDLQPGAITRAYPACMYDGQTGVGDLCWGSDNATLSMAGHGGELIADATVPNVWHLRNDDGTKVEKLTGATNGDNDGEYWKVTTTDGMQYFFGLNRLPGWTTGKAVTGSALTVPVFGNHAAEPCHQSTFGASWCDQAYQWNLDYVLDLHGNSQSYWYAPELNHYARNRTDASVSTYVRAATIARIDYGTRQDAGVDSEYGAGAAQRIVFTVADRCVTPGATCVADTAHASNWPDVPWDQQCNSSTSCPGIYSPVFFTQRKLATATTQVRSGTGYADVERWTLTQVFKDPGDGHAKILWLNAISHAGLRGTTTSMPDVTFTSTLPAMNNRVDVSSLDPIIRFRIASVRTDTGAQINIGYSAQECVKGSNMPASPDSNTKRCFPVYWTPPGASTPALDWFHKYVVTGISVVDTSENGTVPDTYLYSYIGSPAWHYDEAEFVAPNTKTWGQWRGYRSVRTTHGQGGTIQSQADTVFFQGMHNDHLASGANRVVTIPADATFGGAAINDEPWRQGQARETITYNGVGDAASVVSKTLTEPWEYGPTASRTRAGITVNAYLTGARSTITKTALDGGRGWRTTQSTNTFDADLAMSTRVGRVVRVDDAGDTAITSDDRCARITYAENSTNWNVTSTSENETVGVNCAATPNRAVDVVSDVRNWYDGATSFGTSITRGDLTRSEQLSNWNGGNPLYQQVTRAAYDTNGRVVDAYDPLDHHTGTAYTPASGAPVTSTVATNPFGWTTTTTMEPAWGVPTSIVDPNGHRTDLAYDGLGRLTAVWKPGRDKATQTASQTFAYYLHNDGFPSAVVSSSLNTLGTGYNSTYELYDGLSRPRQTQKPAPGGGRIITDTFYDSRGLAYLTNEAYFGAASPSVLLADRITAPSSTRTLFDNAGRTVASIFQVDGVEMWRTSTSYGGDHVDVAAPAGGNATITYSDARGQTTTARQYRGNTPTGTYDTTSYTYARGGQVSTVTDAAGNVWRFGYNTLGRRISVDAPNTGHASYTYDADGNLATSVDARNVTLTRTYDSLDRLVALYQDTVAPANQRAGWTYDTLAKGQRTASTRYVGGASGSAYVTAVTGYDVNDRPTSTAVTIPPAEGALAGTYGYASTYNVDGSPSSMAMPATGTGAGRLEAETLTYDYNGLGMPTTVSGLTTYLTGTDYDSLGRQVGTYASDGGGRTFNKIWSFEYGTNRLAELGAQDPDNGVVYQDVYYTYDPAGNVKAAQNLTNQYGAGPDDNQCFRYDGLRRLTDAWTPSNGDCGANPTVAGLGGPAPYWQSWTYSVTGNRLTQTDHKAAGNTVRTSAYPAAGSAQPDILSSVTTTVPGGGTTTDAFTYDPAGNTMSRAVAGQSTQTLTWDAEGRAASVAASGGTTTYLYDANGNRLLARDPAGTTLYLPDQDVRASGSTAVATRFYGQYASRAAATGLSWTLTDPQGTVDLSLKASDLTVSRRYRTPFGAPRGTNPTWPNTRGFVGGITDLTGLTHLGAREYDPMNGRFISRDPLDQTGDPSQINGYSYAGNAPPTAADPSGLMLHAMTHESGTPTCDVNRLDTCRPDLIYNPKGFPGNKCFGRGCRKPSNYCDGVIMNGDTCIPKSANVPQVRKANVSNGMTQKALDMAKDQGGFCELGRYQIVCYNVLGYSIPSCVAQFGYQCAAQTMGDVMLFAGDKQQFQDLLAHEADKRKDIAKLTDANGKPLDPNYFGPDLEAHEAVHSDQWTHSFLGFLDFGAAYLAQQGVSKLACGPSSGDGVCNKFEIEANPFKGSYWEIRQESGQLHIYAKDTEGKYTIKIS